MSVAPDCDAPDSPPPPAYEFCPQEFDQKVSHALEASAAEQQAHAEEEEWEVWDEAAFEAAVARLAVSDGSGSGSTGAHAASSSSRSPTDASASVPAAPIVAPSVSTSSSAPDPGNGKGKDNGGARGASPAPTVQPLRILKKAPRAHADGAKGKERPSWLAEAQLEPHPAPAPAHAGAALGRSDTMRSERMVTPPPMFTDVGPSLEGPPYEGVVLAYAPPDSPPASPLHSPPPTEHALAFAPAPVPSPPPHAPVQRHGRRSLPQPPPAPPRELSPLNVAAVRPAHQSLPQPVAATRAAATYAKQSFITPRVAFDPRVAYGNPGARSSYFDMAQQEPPPTKVEASALYSSAVASLYASPTPHPPHPRHSQTAPAITSSPYSSMSAAQSRSSYHLPQSAAASSPNLHTYAGVRERAKSPTPSEHGSVSRQSISSHHSAGPIGYQPPQTRPGSVYQSSSAYSAPAPYQTTSYHPTAYQPTSYQTSAYQAPACQAPPPHQPAAPYQSSYQPTSY